MSCGRTMRRKITDGKNQPIGIDLESLYVVVFEGLFGWEAGIRTQTTWSRERCPRSHPLPSVRFHAVLFAITYADPPNTAQIGPRPRPGTPLPVMLHMSPQGGILRVEYGRDLLPAT